MSKPITERRMKSAIKKLSRAQLEEFVYYAAIGLYGTTEDEDGNNIGTVRFDPDKEWTQDTIEDVSMAFDKLGLHPDVL